MRKSIFICIHYLEIGGAEISLIGLLQNLDYYDFEVDLFVYSHQGELFRFVPDSVNLLPEIQEYAMLEKSILQLIKQTSFIFAFKRCVAKTKHFLFRLFAFSNKDDYSFQQFWARSIMRSLPMMSHKKYDLAISFMQPHNYVLEKVMASNKVCWIHTDYSSVLVNRNYENSVWEAYDRIVSISDEVSLSFIKLFPLLESKVIKIENILSPGFILSRSMEFDAREEYLRYFKKGDPLVLLTIGRFSYPKNIDSIPAIMSVILSLLSRDSERVNSHSRIIVNGLIKEVKWFIIGYGAEEQLIKRKIRDAGMEDNVILLGKRNNPYPYIKACDFYVQPSRYEGKAVTVREAQILHKPVIITDYPTAHSQIKNKHDGIIVPQDNYGCAEGIVSMISNEELKTEIIKNLENEDFGYESEVKKIYQLIG